MNTIFNRRCHSIIRFFLLCYLGLFSTTSQALNVTLADSDLPESTDNLLVGIPRGITPVEAKTMLQDANLGDLTIEKIWPEFGIALVKIPERSASPIIGAGADAMQRLEAHRQALEQIPAVNYAVYNDLISISDTADNTMDEYLPDINQSASQTPSVGTSNQYVVVLIDSGFGTEKMNLSNYPLWENQAEINGVPGVDDDENGFIDDLYGWDWIDNDNIMNDELGHGTAVGAALVDLVEEINGDRNLIKLMPLRILREDGKGEISDLVDALAYAMNKDVQIANLNLVSYYNSPPLAEAIRIAHAEGLLMVAALGNLNYRRYWPAAYPETLSVLGVTKDVDTPHCLTNSDIDIAISIEQDDTNLASFELAAPYITAITALALAQNPELSNDGIKESVRGANSCENGPADSIRPLEVEEIIESLQAPTALSEIVEPEGHNLYLPLITR